MLWNKTYWLLLIIYGDSTHLYMYTPRCGAPLKQVLWPILGKSYFFTIFFYKKWSDLSERLLQLYASTRISNGKGTEISGHPELKTETIKLSLAVNFWFHIYSMHNFSDVKQMNSLNRFISRVSNLYDKTLLLKKESMRSENNLRDLIRDARRTYNRIGKTNIKVQKHHKF